MRKVDGDAHRFTRPYQHGVFPAQIAGGETFVTRVTHGELFLLLRTTDALKYLKLKAVDVKRMWHAGFRIFNIPHLRCATLDGDGCFFILIGLAIDAPHHLDVIEGDDAR